MIGSKYFFGLPKIPEISLAPEVLVRIGGFPFTNSLLMTLVVDAILLILVIVGIGRMKTVPRGLQNILELAVELLYGLGESVDRRMVRRSFTLAATIFFFVFFSNFLALIPGVGSIGVCRPPEATLVNPVSTTAAPEATTGTAAEETGNTCGNDAAGQPLVLVPLFRSPSADLNMTLALALIVFVATEYFGFHDLGIGYLGKFFNVRGGVILFIVGIVE